MTKGLLISRNRKIELSKISFNCPFEPHISTFKIYRNLYAKIIRTSKKLYFQKQLQTYQTDAKKTWEILRKAINNSSKKENNIQKIIVESVEITNTEQIADRFNEFFTKVAENVVLSIHPANCPVPNVPPDRNTPLFSLNDNPITNDEIVNAINSLKNKKTMDYNLISSSFVKKISCELATPLGLIFKSSFATGYVPKQLKIAKIVPVFKSGEVTSMDNYRPIALLDTFSKILEKIVCGRLSSFLEFNKLLSTQQFGFRKDHSTLHPMLLFMNKLTEAFEKKQHSIAIFCDLRKAFDTVNHNTLFKKLQRFGIVGIELEWFKSYLFERSQFVSINNISSKFLNINCGVPQGSVLGPLLFILYIDDLPQCSNLITYLFADDTTLLLSHSDINILIAMVNIELKKISYYFRQHGLALHPSKTKFIVFSNSTQVHNMNISIIIDSNNSNEMDPNRIHHISRVKSSDEVPAIRFLGVYFDPNLNFQHHINLLISKLSKSLYILRTTKNILTENARKAIYYALFHSNIIYCLPIWSSTTQKNLKKIVIMQKAAIRIVGGHFYNAHTEPIFKYLKILPFDQLIKFFNLQVMQRYKQGFLPAAFNHTWITNQERRVNANEEVNIVLRNHELLYIPPCRLSSSTNQPYVKLPKTWSEFSEENIKIIRNKTELNSSLKNYILSSLSSTIQCTRLLCPVCHL